MNERQAEADKAIAAMSRFAGPDPRRIHHLPFDTELLIELPDSVQVLPITTPRAFSEPLPIFAPGAMADAP